MTKAKKYKVPKYNVRSFNAMVRRIKNGKHRYDMNMYRKNERYNFCRDIRINIDNDWCKGIACEDCVFHTRDRTMKYIRSLEEYKFDGSNNYIDFPILDNLFPVSSVLSLFDGMSCGQIALNRVGIEYDNYFASEIDVHAIKVTQANYPKTIQLGDVFGIQYEDGALFHHQNNDPLKNGGSFITKIDLLISGSPCQGFGFAGKRLNFEDPRSKLFFEFVRLKNETKPKYFLLENVVMKKEHEKVISAILGVEPIFINSNLVSGKNRKRLYWTNIPEIKQPIDKQIGWGENEK